MGLISKVLLLLFLCIKDIRLMIGSNEFQVWHSGLKQHSPRRRPIHPGDLEESRSRKEQELAKSCKANISLNVFNHGKVQRRRRFFYCHVIDNFTALVIIIVTFLRTP